MWKPLISRIWDGFVNEPHDELLAMIDEFRADYDYDLAFVKNLDTVQDLILAYDYQHALETLDKIAPYDFRDIDWEVFQNTAERAYYEYYE
jgi:hypothetical protein